MLVVFFDENTPQVETFTCYATWAVGLSPATEPVLGTCSNDSVHVSFPSGTYNGVANLYIQIAHIYEDDRSVTFRPLAHPTEEFKKLIHDVDSVGEAPYNKLTLFGGVKLTYSGYGGSNTPNYECDMSRAKCTSSNNAVILGEVTEAIA